MNEIRILIFFSLSLIFSTLIISNYQVFAYKEWHECELNIQDVTPWYNMHLENEHVHMNLVFTNHMNETHTFYVIERIESLTNHEIIKSLPNATLYDNITINPNNATNTLPFSQQLPIGSWYLAIQVFDNSPQTPNAHEVDERTQFFVVAPEQDYYSYVATLVGIGTGVAAFTGLIINAITYRNQARSHNAEILLTLESEFKQIENILLDIHKMKDSTQLEEKKVKARGYYWEFLFFHDKVAYMKRKRMIPKDTARFFKDGFPLALTLMHQDWVNKKDILGNTENMRKWCKKEKIQPRELPDSMKLELPDGILKTPIVKKKDNDLSKGVKLDH